MENHDRPLWELLGQAAPPAAPPFFAAKVMRQIGESPAPARHPWVNSILRWLAPASIAALLLFALLPRSEEAASYSASTDLTTLDLVELVSPGDYDILTAGDGPYPSGFLSAAL